MDEGAMTWRETLTLIQSDIRRLQEVLVENGAVERLRRRSLLLTPEIAALALYRVGHFFQRRNWRRLAAATYRLNITLTGADIHPASRIGPGCLLAHPVGVVIFGLLGTYVSIYARVIVAPELSAFRLNDAPRVGDHVVLGAMSSAIGNVEIASGVHIAPCSLINFSINTPDCMVKALPFAPPVSKSARVET
jgi:serine O-acetyltransferase